MSQKILPELSPDKYEIISYGKVRKLVVKKLHSVDDKGKYECKTGVMSIACEVSVKRKIVWLFEI
jgi:hypothetical protein